MATATFYQQANMSAGYVWQGYVTSATSTSISLTDYRGNSGTYYGAGFTYSGNTVTGGTLTGYDNFKNYTIDYTARGGNVSALTAANFIANGDVHGLASLVLNGNDLINGSPYSDKLLGFAGNDLIAGNGGNDFIDGGSGINTASYSGSKSGYTVTVDGINTATVSGPAYIGEGIDTLINTQRLKFSNGNVALDYMDASGHGGEAYRLYLGVLGRTGEPGGLGYVINRLDQGETLKNVASGFLNSPEFYAKYGNTSQQEFIDLLYQNILHRAPDSTGNAFINDWMNHGASREDVVLGFTQSPEYVAQVATIIGNHGFDYIPVAP